MASLSVQKDEVRKAAFVRRKVAHDSSVCRSAHLSAFLAGHRGVPLAGYMAMRTEIDPTLAMEEASKHGLVGVPVILGAGLPLKFRVWEPGVEMIKGEFGALIPAEGSWMTPEIVIVPLVAYDVMGGRLGYGGGFYDRTLEELRANQATLAVGFAYRVQQIESVPLERTDQVLDLIITEAGQTTF